MKIECIDKGNNFDWGKTSKDYAKYRDIYPQEFYEKILSLGLCKDGQKILDIGTGTGVLPRNMYKYGGKWIGTDVAENQIQQAKIMAAEQKMDIDFYTCPAEKINYPENTFDVITACQCIWYPDHKITAPSFYNMLKSQGKFLILYMGWLPEENKIAKLSEECILKYNPNWNGCGDYRHDVWIPEDYLPYFEITSKEIFDVKVPFTRERWHGRMKACRGVGASMNQETLEKWETEHFNLMMNIAPESFDILHYVSYAELTVKK